VPRVRRPVKFGPSDPTHKTRKPYPLCIERVRLFSCGSGAFHLHRRALQASMPQGAVTDPHGVVDPRHEYSVVIDLSDGAVGVGGRGRRERPQ
jgi:hypothetical protein